MLAHCTLTTGHLRRSARTEVGDDILAVLAPIVAADVGVVRGLGIAIGVTL